MWPEKLTLGLCYVAIAIAGVYGALIFAGAVRHAFNH